VANNPTALTTEAASSDSKPMRKVRIGTRAPSAKQRKDEPAAT
jgi:hypothetical protein